MSEQRPRPSPPVVDGQPASNPVEDPAPVSDPVVEAEPIRNPVENARPVHDPVLDPDPAADAERIRADEDLALVDVLDRVIDRGVVLTGDVMLTVAGVDLVRISLRLLLISVHRANEMMGTLGDATGSPGGAVKGQPGGTVGGAPGGAVGGAPQGEVGGHPGGEVGGDPFGDKPRGGRIP